MIAIKHTRICECTPRCADDAAHSLNALTLLAIKLRAGEHRKQWDLSECELLIPDRFTGVTRHWPMSNGGTRLGRLSVVAGYTGPTIKVNHRGKTIAEVYIT